MVLLDPGHSTSEIISSISLDSSWGIMDEIGRTILTLGTSRAHGPAEFILAKLPISSFNGLAYRLRFSSFCKLLDFSSSWFRWQESADGERFIPLSPRLRCLCLKYNRAITAAAHSPIMMRHTKAIKYLLLCCSSDTKAVSTLTSTIDVKARREVCFLDMASPTTRIPSNTQWLPCCK